MYIFLSFLLFSTTFFVIAPSVLQIHMYVKGHMLFSMCVIRTLKVSNAFQIHFISLYITDVTSCFGTIVNGYKISVVFPIDQHVILMQCNYLPWVMMLTARICSFNLLLVLSTLGYLPESERR